MRSTVTNPPPPPRRRNESSLVIRLTERSIAPNNSSPVSLHHTSRHLIFAPSLHQDVLTFLGCLTSACVKPAWIPTKTMMMMKSWEGADDGQTFILRSNGCLIPAFSPLICVISSLRHSLSFLSHPVASFSSERQRPPPQASHRF